MNIIETLLLQMSITGNFRQIDSKLLVIVDLSLFAVITSVNGVGTIESLDFTITNNFIHIFWSAYGLGMSFAMRWLISETIKKYKVWKHNKTNGKKTN